jgi:hypothetical protein
MIRGPIERIVVVEIPGEVVPEVPDAGIAGVTVRRVVAACIMRGVAAVVSDTGVAVRVVGVIGDGHERTRVAEVAEALLHHPE